MFENVTLEAALWTTLWVVVGLLLRTFGPYCVTAWKLVQETNEWKLPRFEPRYILPPSATLGVYIVAVLTINGALFNLTQMHPTVIIASVYTGQDIFRQVFKTLSK